MWLSSIRTVPYSQIKPYINLRMEYRLNLLLTSRQNLSPPEIFLLNFRVNSEKLTNNFNCLHCVTRWQFLPYLIYLFLKKSWVILQTTYIIRHRFPIARISSSPIRMDYLRTLAANRDQALFEESFFWWKWTWFCPKFSANLAAIYI